MLPARSAELRSACILRFPRAIAAWNRNDLSHPSTLITVRFESPMHSQHVLITTVHN